MTTYQSMRVDGIDLYYQEAGEGPAVAFLHGFGGNHLAWWRQLPAFSDRYRCIAPDQRMFGRSADDPDGPGAAAFADDLLALLDHCGIDRAALIGHSMGGWPVASVATQHPERTAALVLSATPGGLIDPDRHAELMAAAGTPEVDPLTPELSFLSDSIAALNTDRPEEWTDIRPTLDDLPLDPDRIAEAGVPTFLIAGEADEFMPESAIEAVAENVGGAEYAVVEGAGHSSNFERPEAFNRLVGEFLEENAEF